MTVRTVLAVTGSAIIVFAVCGLSGPGRIDILDGQTRYEVARSLVEHGDVEVRIDDYWWCVFPGRDGRSFSSYRLPHSLWGVAAIHLADMAGPASEARRHFYFTMIGPLHCALLAVAFACFFRGQGCSLPSAISWAMFGVFSTPAWHYGSTTFDDILGSTTVVVGLGLASVKKTAVPRTLVAIGSALALGWAFHCKQPLGSFVLVALVLLWQNHRNNRTFTLATFCFTFAGMIALYLLFEHYKYPPGSTEGHEELLRRYAPIFFGNPLMAIVCLLASPAASIFLYCPPVLLGIRGLWLLGKENRLLLFSILTAMGVFVGFISLLTFFKGDPAWGPRYLTPVICVLWMYAPRGALALSRKLIVCLLAAGVAVQILGLSVDSHRLFIQRELQAGYVCYRPEICFHPAASHLLNRPREIVEILQSETRAEAFTPARSPTFAMPLTQDIGMGHKQVTRFHVLNSLRPWWISQWYLPLDQRPIHLIGGICFFMALLLIGGLLTGFALRGFALSQAKHETPVIKNEPRHHAS